MQAGNVSRLVNETWRKKRTSENKQQDDQPSMYL